MSGTYQQYANVASIPLSFERIRAGVAVSGLAVTVTVVNQQTNATLLASTTVPEIASGAGIYNYNWTHGLTTDTYCVATYSVGGIKYPVDILLTFDGSARAV